VQVGVAHRELSGVESIWGGTRFMGTRLARRQLSDRHLPNRHAFRRFAVGGPPALASHAAAGAEGIGAEVVKGLRFVCSDMWKPY